jgi:hypothetical protein
MGRNGRSINRIARVRAEELGIASDEMRELLPMSFLALCA